VSRALKNLAPPPKLTISEWADRFRKLSSESSAKPGQWITSRAEYQRGVMDVFNEGHPYVVMMSSAQVGKTEILNNICGYHIDLDPCPILILQPTKEMGETWSKDRLAPMLRDTPTLTNKVMDPRARDSGNTIDHKRFPGGHITIVGANSPAGLASRPIRIVLADEVDRYPPSAGAEGDPLSLAIKRTQTFTWNRRVFVCSTPTIKGFSRIETEWERSDQRRYFLRCPHCAASQYLKWEQVQWHKDKSDDGQITLKHYPETAAYYCEACGVQWSDPERRLAIRWGEWKATRPEGRIVGFHLNELYSPWSRLADIAATFIEAKKSPETYRTFVNTVLGEPFEDQGERVDDHVLMQRPRWGMSLSAGGMAPEEVLVVTAAVDVQDDRLEIEKVGWGVDEQSWSLDYRVIYGDPAGRVLWAELDEYLLETIPVSDGRTLDVAATAIDSGGHHTGAVYTFCKSRARRRVWAIKGMAGEGKAIWPKVASRNNKGKVNLFMIGVDSAKDSVYARLRIRNPGPGYCHFPVDRERSWFEQLTSERVIKEWVKGFPRRVWQKASSARNEALDVRAYAFAALLSLNIIWHREVRRAQKATKRPVQGNVAAPAPTPPEALETPPAVAAAALAKAPKRRVFSRGTRSTNYTG
jgi:phage terminase large subunit GpA-like protein